MSENGFVTYYTVSINITARQLETIALDADGIRLSFDGGAYYEWSYEDKRFFPENGSAVILATIVPLRPLSAMEILTLSLQTENCNILFFYRDRMPSSYSFFTLSRTIRYTNYSAIITKLEKLSLVKTDKSTNIMCLDERKFTLQDDERVTGSLRKYIFSTYDVDVLGTSLFKELSAEIKGLYRSTLKSRTEEDMLGTVSFEKAISDVSTHVDL